jgi:hypothetical protein
LLLYGLLPALLRSSLVPNSVAPEFLKVAERRGAEQIKLLEGTKKADQAEVLRRDLAAFGGLCLDR